MNNLKLILSGLLLINSTTIYAQGIPTIDSAAIAKQVETWKVEAERWSETIAEYKKAYQAQLDQIATQTGARDIAGFINESKKQYDQVKDLKQWIDNPELLLTHGKNALNSELRAIYDKYGMTNICEQGNEKMKTLCEGEIIITATKEQQNRRDLERVNERVNTINEIADRMAKATDTKEAQDLGNAMQTQIALLQADNIQRDIQAKQFEQQERLIEQQAWNEMARANYEATRSFKSLTD